MLLAASIVFTYYTTWAMLLVCIFETSLCNLIVNVFLQPFFDASSPIHAWFPAREWAVRLPAFILVVGLAGIGAFFGNTIIKENRKKAQQARLRTA